MPAQPSNSWTIQLLNPDGSASGAPMTLASLGIESAVGDENNMAADVLSLTIGGRAIDAADLWPYGQLLALINPSNVRAFVGRVEPWSREGILDKQNHFGRIVNPWWYLDNILYQQRYNIPIFDSGDNIINYTQYQTPRVILYVLYNGVPGNPNQSPFYQANTGQQIADAVNWTVAQGAPIQLGQVDPATTPFSHFQKGIKCSQVIQHAFQQEPDFKIVWDYTTTPFPTVHFLKQQSMVPLLIDLTVPGVREKVKIKSRPDWQRSYVAIHYDAATTVAGQQYISLFNDLYPNPLVPPNGMTKTEFNFRGVDIFCDLTGGKVGIQNQQANFASQPYDITDINIWRKWKPHIDPNVDPTIDSSFIITTNPNFTATSPTLQVNGNPFQAKCSGYAMPAINTQDELDSNGNPVAFDNTCAFEITDGSWADWIPNSNSQRVRAAAFALVIHKLPANAPAGTNPKWEIIPLSHDFTAVNLNTGGISQSFTEQTTSLGYSEPAPLGLAQQMWTSWQNLAIEGNFQNTEAVIGSSQPITNKNCFNFKTANTVNWTNVNAIIQKRTWDIAKGTSDIQFGAPLKLTGNALIDAIRSSRYRLTTVDLAYVFGGALPGSGTTRMARKHHPRHAQHGESNKQVEVIGNQPGGSNATITFDPTVTLPTGLSAINTNESAADILAGWNLNTTPPTS